MPDRTPSLPPELEAQAWAVVDLPPGARGGALARLCQQHPANAAALRAFVERYGTSGAPQAAAEGEVQQVGPYRVLEKIGEGGMGVVYLAEQRQPVRRRVALKVIKPGMDSKAVLARFEAERQALTLMEHSCIARVYDCGATERGQPWFAMEYVKGIPITDYCDQNKLGLQARIELFQRVCSGVQHAHLKGVMHRDLKPSNVLVTLQDGLPMPKVIDFGLAKAMDHRLVEATLFTEQGVLIGTPEYMSPEQAGLGGLDVDTRTDVYALGVLLYELLTGVLPFSNQELRQAGLLEMQRVIRETEPPKPSTRVTTLGDAAAECARQRGVDAGELRKRLRGDLDWIVLRALEKDRTRRYQTALELADDLARHLRVEPVLAGPPSVGYRLRKYLRRYRLQVAAAGLVVVAMGIFGSLAFVQWRRAEDALTESERLRVAAVASESQAVLEKERAESLSRELERRASSEQAAKETAIAQRDRLAALGLFVALDRARRVEQDLYPAWPETVAAMDGWMQGDVTRLREALPGLRQIISDLEALAEPWGLEEQERDRRSHPRFAEWEKRSARFATLRRMLDVASGRVEFREPELPAELRDKPASDLNALAWPRVDWLEANRIWGEELLALACARAASARATGEHRANFADTLAWALFWNGRHDAALAKGREAIELAPLPERPDFEGYLARLEQQVAAWSGEAGATKLAALAQELATLTAEVTARRTFRFTPERESERFLRDTLSGLVDQIEQLMRQEVVRVERRMAWAQRIGELTRAHPNARVTWGAARAAVAVSPKYREHPIPDLQPQMGLVPIGENPVTGLWEFYELRSAWDGEGDPAALPIPTHRPDGSVQVTGETGIVFVLIPGGTFRMGAEKDQLGPHMDPQAESAESPVHEVMLHPCFLARHELTKGQWQRLSGGEMPGWHSIGTTYHGNPEPVGYAHPVEQVDWSMSDLLLRQHGLVLPTEAQWERGCRAGTTTPWWPGPQAKDLAGCANVLDSTGERVMPQWGRQEGDFDDGRSVIGPVGSYRANPFGLHDVHGSVWEWCLDEFGPYSAPVREGDGLRLRSDGSRNRVSRGGGFLGVARLARSSARYWPAPAFRSHDLGLRPARALRTP